jgi:peroxiredoxin (alkyl hydroperoxide reductase subunit C)
LSLLNTPVPDFSAKAVRQGQFIDVSLADLKGHWSVLFFYPGDFTFVCPTELFDLHEQYAELKRMNVEVYAVSTDSVYAHQAWADSTPLIDEIEYPLVADHAWTIAKSLDVLDEATGTAQRATLIVNPEGIIKAVEISDGPVARRAEELLRKVKAAQFVAGGIGRLAKASWAFANATAAERQAAEAIPAADPLVLQEAGLGERDICPPE